MKKVDSKLIENVQEIRKGSRKFRRIIGWTPFFWGLFLLTASALILFYLHNILGAFLVFFSLLAIIGAWLIVWGWKTGWEIYDTGVVKRTIKGDWGILTGDITDVAYQSIWRYTGQLVKLGNKYETIRLTDEHGLTFSASIVYSTSVSAPSKNQRDLFDFFMEKFVPVVTKRMANELERNGKVHWMTGIEITRSGINFSKNQLRKDFLLNEEIPFERIKGYGSQDGNILLFHKDAGETAIFQCEIQETNFFPGFQLIKQYLTPLELVDKSKGFRWW